MRIVSITLQNSPDAAAIVDAILADNPDAQRKLYPAMTKIDCPGRIDVNAQSVSDRLGREWDTQEISMSVISLSGTVDEDDGIFSLYWR
ncbi:monooxygenase (plasmid) [Sphingomonas sp. AAP5]|jgi:phenol hydroxylase P2 protein|uniref:MmoB/DmpM family protein n=1 Tax=Sphingomonas sp. AAP5 TaxID=1523415 RepID=UPI001057060C|nr:MmoB/DmpM family protein [Sphingomonas sp. AAP5]QBM78140.1 monooxygenase [Sphingomonas sp. AAP5]